MCWLLRTAKCDHAEFRQSRYVISGSVSTVSLTVSGFSVTSNYGIMNSCTLELGFENELDKPRGTRHAERQPERQPTSFTTSLPWRTTWQASTSFTGGRAGAQAAAARCARGERLGRYTGRSAVECPYEYETCERARAIMEPELTHLGPPPGWPPWSRPPPPAAASRRRPRGFGRRVADPRAAAYKETRKVIIPDVIPDEHGPRASQPLAGRAVQGP